jgi:hypothetical protein
MLENKVIIFQYMYVEAATLSDIISCFFGINGEDNDMCYEIVGGGNSLGLRDVGTFNIYIMFGEW